MQIVNENEIVIMWKSYLDTILQEALKIFQHTLIRFFSLYEDDISPEYAI